VVADSNGVITSTITSNAPPDACDQPEAGLHAVTPVRLLRELLRAAEPDGADEHADQEAEKRSGPHLRDPEDPAAWLIAVISPKPTVGEDGHRQVGSPSPSGDR
jgi:hypothetical protein